MGAVAWSGRPRRSPEHVAEVKAMACELPVTQVLAAGALLAR
jgi:hypothetical protein